MIEDQGREEARKAFDQSTARYIGLIFASSWTPLPGATAVVQLKAEYDITRTGFETIEPTVPEPLRDPIIRYFVRKRFLLKSASSIPYAGSTMSVVHIYGLSRFILAVADHRARYAAVPLNEDTLDELLDTIWPQFEPTLWDGDAVLSFYEAASGVKAPNAVRSSFATVLKSIQKQYELLASKVPGFDTVQKHGEAISFKAGEMAESVANKGLEVAQRAVETGERLTTDTIQGVYTVTGQARATAESGVALAKETLLHGEQLAAGTLKSVKNLAISAVDGVDAGADATGELAKECVEATKKVVKTGKETAQSAQKLARQASRQSVEAAKKTLSRLFKADEAE